MSTDTPFDASSPAPADATPWTGRDDGPGAEHRRWHHVATGSGGAGQSGGPRVGIVGFASDEGVRRNAGRQGAAAAPPLLRTALAGMAAHRPFTLTDHGDVGYEGQDLESGHDAVGRAIATSLDGDELTLVLGGGHETAWGCYLGRAGSERLGGEAMGRTAVINLDAHFDLRQAERPSSGTPFLQMARAESAAGRELDYTVIGIAEPSNTAVLFETARELGVTWLTDVDATEEPALALVDEILARVDHVHLEIDLDVLPADIAPGVSAPAAVGVPVRTISAVVRHLAASGKLRIVDVAEYNPRYDVDSRTAKVAARLVTDIVHALPAD
ncbi:formimidoylglutamase [Kytococcus sedentarius]|uniref:formimidoylglutamase n=1 Tax=Kytococcus sedentarius TaxID=1276 RepID=UPI00387A50E7